MDFTRCLVNLSLKDDEVVRNFTSLHRDMTDFVKQRDDKLLVPTINVIRFIVACYDKESPIVEQYKKRWTIRKKMASDFAGFLKMDNSLKEDIESILYGTNTKINKLIMRYLSLLFDRDFLTYAVYSEMLIKQSEQLIHVGYDKPSDIGKAKLNIESLQADLNSLEEKIFSGGDVRTLKNVLYEEANKFMVAELRPENIVSKLEKGEPIVDINPYGEGYKIGKPRFIGDN